MKRLSLILIMILTAGFFASPVQALSNKPKFDAMQCLNVAANTTCKALIPNKDPKNWTQEETNAYYKCYYTPCTICWSLAGWNTYPGACCAPGVDCKSL